jgi:hypothetical protein
MHGAAGLLDQPFSSSFHSGKKPHGWNNTRQVRSRGFRFLVPSSILTQSGWMMVRILLKSIVDNSSRTGKKRTSNLLSSHSPAKQDKQHGKHWTTCLIVREREPSASISRSWWHNNDEQSWQVEPTKKNSTTLHVAPPALTTTRPVATNPPCTLLAGESSASSIRWYDHDQEWSPFLHDHAVQQQSVRRGGSEPIQASSIWSTNNFITRAQQPHVLWNTMYTYIRVPNKMGFHLEAFLSIKKQQNWFVFNVPWCEISVAVM